MNKPLNKNTLTPNSFTNFAYNGMKLDNEVSGNGNSYTTLFRELDVRLGRWWAVDLKSEQMPWQSSYNSMDNNPIWHNDPLGDDVDPNASGYADAKKAATPTFKKDGKTIDLKKSLKNGYEPEFAKIFNEFEQNKSISVQFNKTEGDGGISFLGSNDKSQNIYEAHWDPSYDIEMGASGLFEEAYHLKDALGGVNMKFPDEPNIGVKGVDIYDEVRAKMWVAKNINISKQYSTDSELKDELGFNKKHYWSTHYGYINKLVDAESVKQFLRNGYLEKSVIKPQIGSFGSSDRQEKTIPTGDTYKNVNLFPDENEIH